MKILVTGSSGLVGSALCRYLATRGHQPVGMLRHQQDGQPFWQIEQKQWDFAGNEPFDAVVHLAGENIAEGRWNAAKKQRIIDSRVQSTHLLVEALTTLPVKPKVLISASAIGYYGNQGDITVDESAAPGNDFVSQVAIEWEQASQKATDDGIRLVNIRTGMVLSPEGGALKQMLLPFKLGLGGSIGSGQQYISWIDIADMVRAIEFLIENESAQGPVNLVSEHSVTNFEYTKALGKALKRPTIMPMPGFMARLLFGEMADELLLSSTRVKPKALSHLGFEFKYPQISQSLAHLLD